jgi:GDA1/CD39 (nucleoside phosphatase) family
MSLPLGPPIYGVAMPVFRFMYRFEPNWARVVSGVDEGVFGWIALNYATGHLAANPAPAAEAQPSSLENSQAPGVSARMVLMSPPLQMLTSNRLYHGSAALQPGGTPYVAMLPRRHGSVAALQGRRCGLWAPWTWAAPRWRSPSCRRWAPPSRTPPTRVPLYTLSFPAPMRGVTADVQTSCCQQQAVLVLLLESLFIHLLSSKLHCLVLAVTVTVAGVEYPLYSHVHHGFGLNDAFDTSVGLLSLQVWPKP